MYKIYSEGCKLCVQYVAFLKEIITPSRSPSLCQLRATHQSVSHGIAPLTLLQTEKMDAYNVESMKLKGRI